MRIVLFAAFGSLCLALAAHAENAPTVGDAPTIANVNKSASACIDGARVTPTAYSTEEDAEGNNAPCSQFLSTQTLVQPQVEGRT